MFETFFTAFTTFFAVIGPVDTAVILASMTPNMTRAERRGIAARAVFIATIIMLLGYVIIAVPTGIVAVSLTAASNRREVSTQACPNCSRQGHDPDAVHCKYCGAAL